MCDSGCVGNSPQARQQSPQGRRPRKRWEATPALVYGGFISPPRSPERYAAFRQMSRSMDSSGPMPNSTYSTLPDSSYSVNSSRTASMNPSYLGSPISPIRRQCVSFDRGRQSPIAMSTRLSYGQDESGRSSRQMDNSHVTEISEEIVESFEDSGATGEHNMFTQKYIEKPEEDASESSCAPSYAVEMSAISALERDLSRREREERKQLIRDLKKWQMMRRTAFMQSSRSKTR